jgi:acyl phosphate:glycerol-3-phosphate acyltransferase
MIELILVPGAFILASIPTGLIVGLLLQDLDVRQHGSGNIGASNVAGVAGWQAGLVVGLLDIAKGVAPVLLGRGLGLSTFALALVALAAVGGHDFSLFLGFRGGKGVATSFGTVLALDPVVALLAMGTWAPIWIIWGYASLASLGTLMLLPLYFAAGGTSLAYVILASILFGLAAIKHWPNIVRLANGAEPGVVWALARRWNGN